MGLDAWLVSFDFVLSVCFVVFVFHRRKHQVIFFLRPEESMGWERRTNGDTNPVDEGHNRRAGIFLPINPLKIKTSRFDSLATGWG